jgi:hypothetical protein
LWAAVVVGLGVGWWMEWRRGEVVRASAASERAESEEKDVVIRDLMRANAVAAEALSRTRPAKAEQ